MVYLLGEHLLNLYLPLTVQFLNDDLRRKICDVLWIIAKISLINAKNLHEPVVNKSISSDSGKFIHFPK